MKKYVLYDAILDINKTSALVNSAKELLKFLKLEIPSLTNAPRDIGCESIGLDIVAFHQANAKTLALAAREKASIICIEDSSFLSLNLTLEEMKKDNKLKLRIDKNLAKENLELDLDLDILTLADFLIKEVGASKIKKKVKRNFDNFRAALYLGSYQCQIAKYTPSSSYKELFDILGLKLVDYELKDQVSGYEINDVNEKLSYKMSGSLMLDMFDNAADFVIINDARSFIMFDQNQRELEKSVGREIGLSIFCLSEILLLAFGMSDKSKIGLSEHKIKTSIV